MKLPDQQTFSKIKLVLAFALLGLVSSISSASELVISGSLEQFLKSIDYGDNNWAEPSADQEASFRQMVNAFLVEDYVAAADVGNSINYDLIEYTNTDTTPASIYYLLMGQARAKQPGFLGWGVYALLPSGRDALIQAPHPQSDLYTEHQAIELYLDSSSALLALSDARRDSSPTLSSCTGSYPNSDGVHHLNHPFQYFHEAVSDLSSATHFLQLHGFGSSSLKSLKKQCHSNNDNLVNLSEGINYRPGRKDQSLMLTLEAAIDDLTPIEACIYGRDTKSLGATTNTGGRYTNGSIDACNTGAEVSSNRWLHIEQSYQVRSAFRAEMNQAIIQALDNWAPTAAQ